MSDEKRVFESDDIFNIRFLGETRTSPDGQRVLFSLSRADKSDNDYRAHLWLKNSDGTGKAQQFTNSAGRDSDPRWSPDGRLIAFVSNRSGHSEIWIIPANGGEARRLTHSPHGVNSPRWSPNGKSIAFVAKVDEDGPTPSASPIETEDERKKRVEKDRKEKTDRPMFINRLRYKRDGQGLWEGRYSHIWVIGVDEDGDASDEPRVLTSGEWDDADPAWSPDSSLIAFHSTRTDVDDRGLVNDIFVVPAAGGDAIQQSGSLGHVLAPAWSPDGRFIAYVGHERKGDIANATNYHMYMVEYSPDGGKFDQRRDLTGSLDYSLGTLVLSDVRPAPEPEPAIWTADNSAILSTVAEWGRVTIWRFPLDGGQPERVLGGDRQIGTTSYSTKRDKLVFTVTDPVTPGDIYSVTLGADGKPTSEEIRLTEVNKSLFDEIAVAPTEELRFQGDGGELQGWVIKPPFFEPGIKYPAVLEIHGGPHLLYGFSFMHEFQVLAAQGWVVFFMNPRGSQGYGQAFVDAINQQWGRPDYDDIMRGVDVLLEQGFVDPDSFTVTGGSYGGFMTTTIVGKTNRFRAALAQRSVTNLISMYGSSDIGWSLFDWEVGELFGDPEKYKLYWDLSPISLAPKVETPIMIIHGEQDLRCNIEQSEEYYVALKRLGKQAEFVRFPGASHGLSRNGPPKMRVHRLNTIVGWMKRFIP